MCGLVVGVVEFCCLFCLMWWCLVLCWCRLLVGLEIILIKSFMVGKLLCCGVWRFFIVGIFLDLMF